MIFKDCSKTTLSTEYDSNHEINLRRKKLSQLRLKGMIFPNNFRRNIISSKLYKQYSHQNNDELKMLKTSFDVAGRIVGRRIMGKTSFISLQDMDGIIQLYIVKSKLPLHFYDNEFRQWDLGDIIGARGTLFKTKTGELTINCCSLYLLTKALRPLPSKFHGLVNQETKYRKRYLDLIINKKTQDIFKARSKIILEIRKFMLQHEFMEVETPMMQNIPGGAEARPFITHHNTLNINMYLRVSPELYLKQLVIGGFERVFEINRNFRNEGLSSFHNPEFTMLEFYMAYADYSDVITLTENLIRTVSKKVLGYNVVKYGNLVFDFSQPFIQITMKEAICNYKPDIKSNIDNKEFMSIFISSLGIQVDKSWGIGKLQQIIFEAVVVKHLIQPTFITSYPIEVSPMARRNDIDSMLSDRFELFIGGREIGNGFSELNDPEDQEKRFIEQVKSNDMVNQDINKNYNLDYIVALEHGLPPTAGVGIGVDRLVMLLTNSHSIKDVILFPTLRLCK